MMFSQIFTINLVFLLQLFSSLFMLGLIWFVQIVHYPLFAHIDPKTFPHYAKKHQLLTSWVVGPVMLLEAFSALYLIVMFQSFWINFLCVFLIWLSTACLQIPLHGKLTQHFDQTHIKNLVTTNWVRTVLWTLKSILLLSFLMQRL